jgi:hypothetical protein
MRAIFLGVILVLMGLGTTDLVANFLESRDEAHRPNPTLAADPVLKPAPAPVAEQE